MPLEQFHRFLQEQGLQPADLGAASWREVKPLKDAAAVERIAYEWGPRRAELARRTYYWTHRYAQHLTAAPFREATGRVEQAYPPGTLTFVNFTDHPLIIGGRMLPGIDWFEVGLSRATTLMWTEDWLYTSVRSWGNGLYQRLGFLCDLLVIGHGVKMIDFFHYGPTYAATENYWSESESQYRGVAKLIRDVGKAEELLYPGQPVPAEVAIVYGTTAEIWGQPAERGHEKQLIHIALAQEQYPCDVVNEDLLRERDLLRYKVIYLVDTHLPADCLAKLRGFVERGGTLCLVPGAGERDEYDHPCDELSALTAGEPEGGGEGPFRTWRAGKGRVCRYEALPGKAFFQAIRAANPSGPVVNFPAAERRSIVLPCRQAGVARPVELSVPGLEADLLVSERGAALVLVNMTRRPIADLQVRVSLGGVRAVRSVEHGRLPHTVEGEAARFSLPLGLTDIVLLER